jgi:catalase
MSEFPNVSCMREAPRVLDLDPSPALSIQKNMKAMQGRKVGVLFADGSDRAEIKAVRKAVEDDGGEIFLVAPKVGGAKLKGGSVFKANGQLAGSPSQLFDAVAVIISKEDCKTLMGEAAAVQFVMDAFGHLKAIGSNEAAGPLLKKAGVVPGDGVTGLGKEFVKAARVRFGIANHPSANSLEPFHKFNSSQKVLLP